MTILTFESHANYCILYATVNNKQAVRQRLSLFTRYLERLTQGP